MKKECIHARHNDGVDDGVVAAVLGVHRILSPQWVARGVRERNTQTWVDDFKTKVIGEKEILEEAARLHEALPEDGLETVVESVGGMVVCTTANAIYD